MDEWATEGEIIIRGLDFGIDKIVGSPLTTYLSTTDKHMDE